MAENVFYTVNGNLAVSGGKALKTTKSGPGYYDCGYGCTYYTYDPGCTECNPSGVYYLVESVYQATNTTSLCSSTPDHTIIDLYSSIYGDVLRDGGNYFNANGTNYTPSYSGYYSNSLGSGTNYGTFSGGVWTKTGTCL